MCCRWRTELHAIHTDATEISDTYTSNTARSGVPAFTMPTDITPVAASSAAMAHTYTRPPRRCHVSPLGASAAVQNEANTTTPMPMCTARADSNKSMCAPSLYTCKLDTRKVARELTRVKSPM